MSVVRAFARIAPDAHGSRFKQARRHDGKMQGINVRTSKLRIAEPSAGRELAIIERLDKNSIAIQSKTGGRSRR
jgi:hypothetical protein